MPKPNPRFSRKRRREACSSWKPESRIWKPESGRQLLVWHDLAWLGVKPDFARPTSRRALASRQETIEGFYRPCRAGVGFMVAKPDAKVELLSSVTAERSPTGVLSQTPDFWLPTSEFRILKSHLTHPFACS